MKASILFVAVSTGLALSSLGSPARALTNLVQNGDFETFVNPNANSGGTTASYQVQTTDPTSGATTSNNPNGGVLANWSNAGYTFLFNAGTADTTGSYSSEYNNYLKLWGPNDGSANGLTAASPTGGNFIGSDGAYQQGAIQQTISGLTVGYAYTLSFYWAAGQQSGYTGATTESWGVTFGGQTYNTQTVNNASMGFTPWRQASFTFVPTSTTQTLSFLAAGAPSGTPPFSLLDGVTLYATPEPATWAVLAGGLAAMAMLHRRRKQGGVPGVRA